MSKIIQTKKTGKVVHWPTLNTVIMVENAIKNSEDSVISIPKLKRSLPRQVNHNTLMIILHYLDQSNKIYVGLKGITWIQSDSEKMRKLVKDSIEI